MAGAVRLALQAAIGTAGCPVATGARRRISAQCHYWPGERERRAPVIPRPRSLRSGGPGTTLTDGMVVAADDESAGVASLLAGELEKATGWRVRRDTLGATNPNGVVQLSVRPGSGEGAGGGAEGYRLRVSETGVEIVAPSAAGVFYGTRTLRQLLPPALLRSAPASLSGAGGSNPSVGAVELEGVEVEDGPRFEWRGIHLDVGRHFFPKSFVLRLIDLASLHKLNRFHLHLTDDQGWRFEVDRYPLLTQVGAWRRESPVGHNSEGARGRYPAWWFLHQRRPGRDSRVRGQAVRHRRAGS